MKQYNIHNDLITSLDDVKEFCDKLHGSGINYNWHIEDKKSVITAYNNYDSMNEAGMYDYVIPFKISFPKHKPMRDFKLFISGYAARKYMLKEYLEDTIVYTIDFIDEIIYNGCNHNVMIE